MLTDLREINEQGGIQATNTATGADIYIAPGDLLHDIILSGVFGDVPAYVAPPPPEVPPVYPTKPAVMVAFAEFVSSFTLPLIGDIPEAERLAFSAKEAAARAYVAGSATAEETSMIEGEAALTGEAPADLAGYIIMRADIYRKVIAYLSGLRRKLSAQLDAAPDAYQFETLFLAAQGEAAAWVTSEGLSAAFGEGDA
ncbi:MAG: hypothetical protein AAGK03_03620 [Pseudomonadota bacterium]